MRERYLVQAVNAMGDAWVDLEAFTVLAHAEHLAAIEPVGARIVDTHDRDKVIAEWKNGEQIL